MKVSEAFLAEVNDLDPDNKYSRINPKLVARHRTHTYHSNKWEYLSARQVYTDSEYHSVCTKTDRYFKHQIETLMNLLRGHKRGAGSRAKSMEKEHIKLYSSDGSTPTRDFSSGRGDRRARSRPIERTHMTTSPFSTKLRRQLGHESLFDQNNNAGNYYIEASPSFSPLKEKFKSEFGSLEGFKSISSDEFLRSARRGRSGRDQEIENMRTEIVMQPDQGYDSLRGSHTKKIRRSRRDRENKNHDMTFSNKDDYSSTPSHSMGDTEREYISTKESPKVPHLDELIRDRKIGRDGYASSGTPVDADNEKYHSRLFNTPKKEATPPTKSSKGNEYIQQVLDIRFAASPKDNEKTGVFRSPIRPSRSINKKKTAENEVSEENKQGNTGSEKRQFSESKDENRKAFLTENSSYGSLVNYSSQERLPGIKRDMVLKSDRSSEKGLETQSGRVTEREEIGPWARSSEEQVGSMSSDNRTDSENKGGLIMNMEERKSERQTPRENKKRASLSNSEDLRDRLSEEEQRLRKCSTERRKLSDNKSDGKNEEYVGPDKLIEEINKDAFESRDNNTAEIKNMMSRGLWNIEEDASKELSRFSDPEHVDVSPYGNNEEFKLQEVERDNNIDETLKLEETEKLDSFREDGKENNDLTDNIITPNELENNASHPASHNDETLDIDGIGKNEEEFIQEMIISKNSVTLEEPKGSEKEEFKEDRQTQKMSEEISFAQIKIEKVKTNENNMQESQEEEQNNMQESKDFSGEEHNNLSLNDQEEVITYKIYDDKDSDLHTQEEQAKSESIESHINIYENLNKDFEDKYITHTHQGENFESRDEESIQDKIEDLVNESNEENAQAEEEKQDENILSERKYSEKEKIGSEDNELDQFKQVMKKRKDTDYKASDLEENADKENEREAQFEERVNDSLSGNIDEFIEKRHENHQLEEVEEIEKYVEEMNKSTENIEEVQQKEEENKVESELVFQNSDSKEENVDNPSIDSLENKDGEKTEKYEHMETKIEQTAEHGRGWKKQVFSRQQTEKHEMTFCEEIVDNVSNDSLQNISEHKKQSKEGRSEIDGADEDEEQILEQNSYKEEAEERYDVDSARNKMKEEREEEKLEDDKIETENENPVVEEVDDRVSIEDAKENPDNMEIKSEADVIQESNGEILADTMDHLEQERQSFVKSEIEEEKEVKIENIEDQQVANAKNSNARKESEIVEKINESQASIEQSSKWEKNESLREASQQESLSNQDSLKEVMKSGSKRRGRNDRKKASNKKEVDEEAEKFVQECVEEDINLKNKVEEQQDKTLSEKASLESFVKQENVVEGLTQKDDLHEKQKTSRKGTLESQKSDHRDSLAKYSSVKSRGSDSVRSGQENYNFKEEEKSNKRKLTESLNSLPKSQSNSSANSLSLVENNEQENIQAQMSGIMDNQADFSDVQKSVRKDTFESQRTDRKDDITQRKESLRKSSSGVKSNSDEHLNEENKKARSRVSSHVSKSSSKDKIINSLNNEQNLQSRTSSKNAILTEYKEPEEIKDQIPVAKETEKSLVIDETQKPGINVPANSLVLDEDDEQESLEDQKLEFSRGEPLEQEINLDRGQNQEKRKKVYLMPESIDQVPTSTVKSLPKTEKEAVMGEDLTWEDIRMIRQIQLQAAIIIQRRLRQFLQEKRAQQAQRAKFYLEKIDPEDLKAFANSLKRNENLSEGIRSFSPKKRKEDMIELMLAFVSSYSVLGKSQVSNRK